MKDSEKVICAAIWFKDIHPRAHHRPTNTPGGVVLCGHRHPHVISQINAITGKKMAEVGKYIDGFLTDRNRFVDREEGANIFISNGGELKYSKTKLFSEDLY